jgi:hypothetical protein
MRPVHHFAQALLLLLCSTTLLARAGGDHVHLCLDGQEAPATIHGADGGVHHLGVAAQSHNDRDVDLLKVAAAKDQSTDSQSPPLPVAHAFKALLPNMPVLWTPAAASIRLVSPLRHLRPPLRGPPL